MKLNYYVSILLVLLCVSCQKEGVKLFKGDYSYQTSGKLNVVHASGSSFSFSISKQGQIDMFEMKDSEAEMLMIKREFNAELSVVGVSSDTKIYELKTTVEGDSIFLNPYSDEIQLYINDTINGSVNMRITGAGTMYDDHMIITEKYSGTLTDNGVQIATITGESIKTAAEKN